MLHEETPACSRAPALSATGLIAGPESPPPSVLSRVCRPNALRRSPFREACSRERALRRRHASPAAAISTRSATFGLNFTHRRHSCRRRRRRPPRLSQTANARTSGSCPPSSGSSRSPRLRPRPLHPRSSERRVRTARPCCPRCSPRHLRRCLSSFGSSLRRHSSTPGPCRPTELRRPLGVSRRRGAGFPSPRHRSERLGDEPPECRVVEVALHLGSVPCGTRRSEDRVLQHHRADLRSQVDRSDDLPQEPGPRHPVRASLPGGMHLLQAQHRQRMTAPLGDARCGSPRGGDRRKARNPVKLSFGPDVRAVGARAPASWRVDDQLNRPRRYQLCSVRGSRFADLGRDRRDRHASCSEVSRGARRRGDLEAEATKRRRQLQAREPCPGRRGT